MGLGNLASDDEEEEEEEQDEIVVESTEVEPADGGNSLIKPADNLEEVAELYEQFEQIKDKLLKSSDTTPISGNVHINKSGWRKIATAFNVSVEVVEDETWIEDGIVKCKVKAVATAPNGKSATGEAMCASNESNHMEYVADDDADRSKAQEIAGEEETVLKIDGKWRRLLEPREVNEHNIYATACTRAKNRAISDCVGGGEVSAEEIGKEDVFD